MFHCNSEHTFYFLVSERCTDLNKTHISTPVIRCHAHGRRLFIILEYLQMGSAAFVLLRETDVFKTNTKSSNLTNSLFSL